MPPQAARLAAALARGLLAAPLLGAAPGGILRGVVESDGRPVPAANVMVLGTRVGTMTDTAGRFALEGVSTGIRQVRVLAIGYERRLVPVQVAEGENPPLTITLHPNRQWGNAHRPACDPYFEVDPHQGDQAVPPGAMLIDRYGDVDRARTSDSTATLQFESVADPCVLEVLYEIRVPARSARALVLDAAGDTVRLFEGNARAQLRWDGTYRYGRARGPGLYRVVLDRPGGTCQLLCQRVVRRPP